MEEPPYDPAADDWTPPPVPRGSRKPDHHRLVELVRAGAQTADIMAALGCTKQRVYRARARLGLPPPTELPERVRRASAAAATARAAKRATFQETLRRASFEEACAAAGYSHDRGRQVLAAAIRTARVQAVREHPSHLDDEEAAAWRARRVRASWATRRARRQKDPARRQED